MNIDNLAAEFAKAVAPEKKPAEETALFGTVVEDDGELYVQLDGSDQLMPVESTVELVEGQKVTVTIKDHRAIADGCISDKSITRTTANGLINIFANDGTFSGTLSAPHGNIGGWSLATSAIYRGSSTWKDADGMYFGSNGLSIKDKFSVASNGTMTAYSGIFYGNNDNIRMQIKDAINVADNNKYSDIAADAPPLFRITNYRTNNNMMRIIMTGERIKFYDEYRSTTINMYYSGGKLYIDAPDYIQVNSPLRATGDINSTGGALVANNCTAWDSGNAGGSISSTGRMALVTPSSSGYPNIMFVVNKSTSKYTQLRSTNTNGTYTLTLPNSTGTLATTSSDIRLKENIKDSEVSGLDLIEKIKLHEFDWKPEAREGAPHWNIGMIADELEDLDENLTFGGGMNEDGSMNVKGIETTCLISYLVKAVQELSAEVKALRGEKNVKQ